MRITGLGRRALRRPVRSISRYGVGPRQVELLCLSDGSVTWACNCERFSASAGTVYGPWCKHIAKAAAIRSIERLTGERVISREIVYGGEPAAADSPQAQSSNLPAAHGTA